MDTYEGLIDNSMAGNSNTMADYQVSTPFSQFQDGSSYSGLPGLPGSFSSNPPASGTGLNLSGYSASSSQQSGYGNISSGSSSSFSMPYDPPTMQQGSGAHLQIAAPSSSSTSQVVSNKTIHSCTYCGLVLSSANALIEHKRIHTGDRPFSCHICNKRFTQKAHLNIHKRIHTGEKPYACHICHKRFAQSSHLTSHKRIHTGEKPFVCEICQIGFTQKQRLDTHLKKHLESHGADGVGSIRPGQLLGPGGQLEQFRQGPTTSDENAFMQMIGHGMPYVKQETGLTGDTAAGGGSSSSSVGSIGARTGGSTIGDMPQGGGRGQNYRRSRRGKREASGKIAEDEDSELPDPEKSPRISAPSFSSEGMFLHPSGYVAYGGIEDSEESNDHSPGSNTTESTSQPGVGASSAGHRRKPTVVRKRYSESPAKEPYTPGSAGANSNNNYFHHFSQNQGNDNSDGDLDESGPEDFHDTGETLDDKNDPPYHGSLSNKPGVRSAARNIPPLVAANNAVETRSHSRRSLNRPLTDSMNGDKLNPSAQAGTLTYVAQNNSMSNSGLVKVNSRISLVNFTAEELIAHLMKRDDIHKCQFCCLIFQDAAMYHIHRNMHDKGDVRRCNMCGKLLQDKYDFTAHFLNMHQN